MRPIFLLSDFGSDDIYVGSMKSVLASIAPSAQVYDLTHGIQKFNVEQAALRLRWAFTYLPDSSIVLAIVDPGVGSERRAIAVLIDDRIFIGPDNGIFSLLPLSPNRSFARELNNIDLHLKAPSHTFHGRDLFAPVAAHLSNGAAFTTVGSEIAIDDLTLLANALNVVVTSDRVEVRVIDIDSFGNLVLSVRRADLPPWFRDSDCLIECGGITITALSRRYADGAKGELLCLEGSSGFLEIARREGRASDLVNPTDPVVFRRSGTSSK